MAWFVVSWVVVSPVVSRSIKVDHITAAMLTKVSARYEGRNRLKVNVTVSSRQPDLCPTFAH